MLPNRLVLRAYAVRGFTLWLLVRLLVGGLLFLAGENPVGVSPIAVLYIVTLSGIAGFFEMKRRHELALLGNLGVTKLSLIALLAVPAIGGEMVLALGALPFR